MLKRTVASALLAVMLAACSAEQGAAPEDGAAQSGAAKPVENSSERGGSDSAQAGEELEGLVRGDAGEAPAAGAMSANEALMVIAELGRPGMELTDEQAARLQAANDVLYGAKGSGKRAAIEDRLGAAAGAARSAADARADWEARQPEDWKLPHYEARGGEAALIARTGDVDNLGFGWPADFDPFSGTSTPPHTFPFRPDSGDPQGTDRIMVISGYERERGDKTDGYTERTRHPSNAVKPITLTYDPKGINFRQARLQIFVDDFQAPSFGNLYGVWINGEEIPYMAEVLNTLRQKGPIGKLVTFEILPEHLHLLTGGEVEILIDDPYTDAGDGFAIDFVRLLVNPAGVTQAGLIEGTVTSKAGGEPLKGILVSAAGVVEGVTGADGAYRLEGVPAGLAVITASHADYKPASDSRDLIAGETEVVDLQLEPRDEQADAIGQSLEEAGRIDLYGILFDTNEATLRPESEETLKAVLAALNAREGLAVRITGHTDSVGADSANQTLSERRAQAVVGWLVDQGIEADRLSASGAGEGRPAASNETEEGRARNRRVELAVRR